MDETGISITVRKAVREKLDGMFGADGWKMMVRKDRDPNHLIYLTRKDLNEYVAYGYLAPFPGCCGLMVSWGATVAYAYRHQGIGAMMNLVRMDYATELGYGQLICTDKINNDHQRRILTKNGWKDILEFTNPRTHNHIAVSVVKLQ